MQSVCPPQSLPATALRLRRGEQFPPLNGFRGLDTRLSNPLKIPPFIADPIFPPAFQGFLLKQDLYYFALVMLMAEMCLVVIQQIIVLEFREPMRLSLLSLKFAIRSDNDRPTLRNSLLSVNTLG